MWVIGSIVAFAIALILHLAGEGAARHWVDAMLAGLICLAVALAGPAWPVIRRRP